MILLFLKIFFGKRLLCIGLCPKFNRLNNLALAEG